MSIKLEDFRLESYKERELLMMALTYYESHRADDIKLLKLSEALESLSVRISQTWCQPNGCELCNPEGNPDWRNDHGDL